MNYNKLVEDCSGWIQNWFSDKGPDSNAIIGISGGKDSTVAAALCVKALGKQRVIGVAMPSEGQGLNDADEICKFLGIRFLNLPIGKIEQAAGNLGELLLGGKFSKQSILNIPPRIRMMVLYAAAQSLNGFVANTCNLSEDYIGYATLFGDAAGSFSPLRLLCVREVIGMGEALGLPEKWVRKTPDDGLPGSAPDEEKIGFSYAVLDKYIREGICEDEEIRQKIDRMHSSNLFKTEILNIPAFNPQIQ